MSVHLRGQHGHRASVAEWGTVMMPNDPSLSPDQLHALGAAARDAYLPAQPRPGEDKRYASLLRRNTGSLAVFVLRHIYWAQGRVVIMAGSLRDGG